MIVFNGFAVCDMPKTGGAFIRNAFGYMPEAGYYERLAVKHRVFDVDVPTYAFVRSPLSWYVSYVSFVRYGSNTDYGARCPVAKALSEAGALTVEAYFNACLGNDADVRRIVANTELDPHYNIFNRVIEWARSDTADLYSWMLNYFTSGATVLRHEDLSDAVVALSEKYNQPILVDDVRHRQSVTTRKVAVPEYLEQQMNSIQTKDCLTVKDI